MNKSLRHPQDPTIILELTSGLVLGAYPASGLESPGPYRVENLEGVMCAFDDEGCWVPSCVGVAPRVYSREEFLATSAADLFGE